MFACALRKCSPYPGGFISAITLESENCDDIVWHTEKGDSFGPIMTSGGFGDIVNYIYTDLGDNVKLPNLDTCINSDKYPDIQWVWNNQMFNTMTYDFNFANLEDTLDKCCGTESPTPAPVDTTEPPIPTPNPTNNTEPTGSPTRIPIDIDPPSLPPTPANCSCKVDVCAHGMCDVELFISQDGGLTFNSLIMTSDPTDPLELDSYCIDADTILRFEVEHSQYVPKYILVLSAHIQIFVFLHTQKLLPLSRWIYSCNYIGIRKLSR